MNPISTTRHTMRPGIYRRNAPRSIQRSRSNAQPFFQPATKEGGYATEGGFFSAAPVTVQAKLTVNQPGDAHEQEADQVADQIMRMPEGSMPVVQRQATGGDAGGHAAPPIVSQVLSSGGGLPMDSGTRQFMESRMGQDFSQVRVHTDARAAESARAIQARAYTSGRDVVFGSGEYRPESEGGKRLLAHELVHVGQQSGVRKNQNRDFISRVNKNTSNGTEVANLPKNADALQETPTVKRLKKVLQEKGKDAFFEELRKLSSKERSDVSIDEFIAQNLVGNDLWVAQNILKLGPEANWPVNLKIERALTGLDDNLGLEAALIFINAATAQEKLVLLSNENIILKIRNILNFDNVELLVTELRIGARQLLASGIVNLSILPFGPIREATAQLLVSTDLIDRNTAIQLLHGNITAYYIEDLLQPKDVDNFTLKQNYNPKENTFYFIPPENTELMLASKDVAGFQGVHGNIFVRRTNSIDVCKDVLVHETNHALNVQTTTYSGPEIIERYKSEFRAFWVAGFRHVTNEDLKAKHLKNEILDKYAIIKKYYDTDPDVKTAIDNYTRPDGNLINR